MKKVNEIQQGVLNHIFHRLNTLNAIENQVLPYVPCELRDFCKVANFDNNILTFAVKSGAWANQLKFSIPKILECLRTQAGLPALISISYYIEPEFEQLFC